MCGSKRVYPLLDYWTDILLVLVFTEFLVFNWLSLGFRGFVAHHY